MGSPPPSPLVTRALSLAELARALRESTDESSERWILVLEFIEGFHQSEPQIRPSLLLESPPTIDHDRWDVLLGALAEHFAIREEVAVPAWALEPSHQWCGRAWFVGNSPSQRVWALAWSPASFRARGIFLHPDELTRDGID